MRVLAKRLHALERRIGTTDEPLTTVVQYVVPGGEGVGSMEYLIRPRASDV